MACPAQACGLGHIQRIESCLNYGSLERMPASLRGHFILGYCSAIKQLEPALSKSTNTNTLTDLDATLSFIKSYLPIYSSVKYSYDFPLIMKDESENRTASLYIRPRIEDPEILSKPTAGLTSSFPSETMMSLPPANKLRANFEKGENITLKEETDILGES